MLIQAAMKITVMICVGLVPYLYHSTNKTLITLKAAMFITVPCDSIALSYHNIYLSILRIHEILL